MVGVKPATRLKDSKSAQIFHFKSKQNILRKAKSILSNKKSAAKNKSTASKQGNASSVSLSQTPKTKKTVFRPTSIRGPVKKVTTTAAVAEKVKAHLLKKEAASPVSKSSQIKKVKTSTKTTPVTTKKNQRTPTKTLISTKKSPISTKKNPVSTRRAPISTKRTSVSTKRTSVSTKRTSVSTKRTSVSTKRTSVSTKRTSDSTVRTSVSTKKSPASSKKTRLSSKKTPLSTKKTPVSTKRTPVSTKKASVPTKKTPVSTKKTPVSTKKTPVNNKETLVSSKKSSVSPKETSTSTKKTPVSTKRTPAKNISGSNKKTPVSSKKTPVSTKKTPVFIKKTSSLTKSPSELTPTLLSTTSKRRVPTKGTVSDKNNLVTTVHLQTSLISISEKEPVSTKKQTVDITKKLKSSFPTEEPYILDTALLTEKRSNTKASIKEANIPSPLTSYSKPGDKDLLGTAEPRQLLEESSPTSDGKTCLEPVPLAGIIFTPPTSEINSSLSGERFCSHSVNDLLSADLATSGNISGETSQICFPEYQVELDVLAKPVEKVLLPQLVQKNLDITHSVVDCADISTAEKISLQPERENTSYSKIKLSGTSKSTKTNKAPLKFASVRRAQFSFGRTHQKGVIKSKPSKFLKPVKKHLKSLCADDFQKLICAKTFKKTNSVDSKRHKSDQFGSNFEFSSQKHSSGISQNSTYIRKPTQDLTQVTNVLQKSKQDFRVADTLKSCKKKKTFAVVRLTKLPDIEQKSRINLSNSTEEDFKLFLSESQTQIVLPKLKLVKPQLETKKKVSDFVEFPNSKNSSSGFQTTHQKQKSRSLQKASSAKKQNSSLTQELAVKKVHKKASAQFSAKDSKHSNNKSSQLVKNSKRKDLKQQKRSKKLVRRSSSELSDMDFLQCGRCSSTFTSLKLFISHKKNSCKLPTTISSAKPAVKKLPTPKSDPVKKKLPKHNVPVNSEKCGECPGCLRRKDCSQCQSCLDNKIASDPKLKKQCLLRECELFFENQVYQVEKLVGKRLHKARTEYLVKWKGYPDSENTWEPEANVISRALIAEFEQRQKEAKERGEESSDSYASSQKLGKRDTRPPSPPSSPASLSSASNKRQKLDEETLITPTADQLSMAVQLTEAMDVDSISKTDSQEASQQLFPVAGAVLEEEEENPNLTEIKLFLASEFEENLNTTTAESTSAAVDQTTLPESNDPATKILDKPETGTASESTEDSALMPAEGETAVLTYTTLDGAISKTVQVNAVLPSSVPDVVQRNARKSMKSSNRYNPKEVSDLLEEMSNDTSTKAKVYLDDESLDELDEEIAALEEMEEAGYFDEEDDDIPRKRHTKQAALDFIRTVCHNIKQRQKTEAELEAERNRRRRKRMLLMGGEGQATDSYEKNLDLSKATSAIYIQNPDEPSSYILVKGDQEQISFLEGANLSPQVIVNAKEPLRQATPWVPLPPSPPSRPPAEETSPDVYDQEVEGLPSTSGGVMEENFEDLFGIDDSSWGVDPSLSDTSSIMGGDISGTEGPPPAPLPRKRMGRPALPPSERKVLTPFGGAKRKPGRPPKSESLARLAMLRELQGDSANSEDTMESTSGRQDENVPNDLLGMYERRRQKPRQFDEYIDPDTLLKDEPENVVVPGRRSLKHQDEDFEPPTLPKPPTGRPRGRPPKHYNINDITDEMDFRRKFIKTIPQKSEGGRGRGKKNRVFVVMPDGTMVEVSGNDREKAIARATAKMEVLRKNVGGRGRGAHANDDHGGNLIGGMRRRTDMRPSIEECTTDTVDDPSMLKLPSTVQLVESELPLTEAENGDKLVGMFLFRQIYSPNDPNLFCLMCRNKYPLTYPVDLEKHYHVIHELGVQIFKAEFSENIVFVCVPSDVSEDTMLNSGCRFCDETLKTLSEVRTHYPEVHGKNVRLVPENSVMELGEHFYCSICSQDSKDFNDHHKHMKEQHRMHTYACRFCNFCTPKPNRLRTHVKQRHLQEQPGPHLQCSVCSVYVHGKERLNKHILLSHAVQTGLRTWSCAKCLQPCGDARELMAHIHKCPFLLGQNQMAAVESAAEAPDEDSSSGKSTLFYKCTLCSLTFSSEDDIKRHMAEGIHNTAGEELSTQGELKSSDLSDPAVVALGGSGGVSTEGTSEDSTCFLCHLRFPSKDQCLLHQHHVHMRWVAKGVVDYSAEELPDLPPDVIVAETLELSQLMKKNIKSPPLASAEPEHQTEPLTAEEEEARALERALMEGLEEPMQEDGKEAAPSDPPAVAPVTTEANSHCKDLSLSMSDIPSDQKLAELGFPTKVGHFCNLCDAVIKSYALYYLHMHNLHGLERRFQCIVSACSRTYHSPLAFQRHAQTHNQKSEHLCSMCDHVFNNDDELQDHLLSPEHATKYMRVQEKYNRSEPRNYRCKVCHSWFGLFATFVKHMETESHQYQCQHCGLLFVQPGPRRNHIQSIHPELANICEICGVQMPSSQALWSHLSLHSIVHECQKCHRRFLQKEQLTAHMEIHAPPTPCPWEGCNRKLSTKVGLYNHLRMHRGDADYKCSVCNKGFFKKKTLEAHMRVHEENPNGVGVSVVAVGRGRGRQSKQQQLELNPSLVFQHQGEDLELTDAEQVLAEQQMAESLQIDLPEGGETENTTNAEPMTSVELVQLICAGCLNGFDSEEQFTQHACVGHATPEQAEAAVALLSGQDQQIILQTDNSEELGHQLAGQHPGIQALTANDEDLAAQLAKAVAEATGPGGGRVTVSFASGQPVAMVNGQVVTMATIGEDGQPIETTLESLIASGAVSAGDEGLSIEDAALLQEGEQPMEEHSMMVTSALDEEQANQEASMEPLEHSEDQVNMDHNIVQPTEEEEAAVKEDPQGLEEHFAVGKETGTEFIVAAETETELPVAENTCEGELVSHDAEGEYAVEADGEEVMEDENTHTDLGQVSEHKEEEVSEEHLEEKTVMITEEEAYLLASVQSDALDEPKDEPKDTLVSQEVGDTENLTTETVMITEEEAYLLASVQGENLEHQEETDKAIGEEEEEGQDQGALAITMGEEGQDMNIVMMVGDENGELDGNQPYSVVKVPTADGGEQVLLIPLTTTEGGETVLALPDNLTLADQEGGQMAVAFEQQGQEQEEEQVYMTLPVMSEDQTGMVPGGEVLESADVPHEETPDISDTL